MEDWKRQLIEENIPGFDFEKVRDQKEMQSVVRVALKKAEEKRKQEALENTIKLGFQQGISVESLDGSQQEIIKKISSDGHLILEGRKGSFNICGWKIV